MCTLHVNETVSRTLKDLMRRIKTCECKTMLLLEALPQILPVVLHGSRA